ncbi:MAG TPA: hypothetical protein VMT56_02760 [Candidatus Bathyarchaeia archaeon]|nr:hypothetical protein [Candidatus Bathyarchaeia archaeon]
MDRITRMQYREREVLLVDASDCSAAELTAVINEVPQHVTREPLASVLILGDFSRAVFTKDNVEHLKIAAVFDKPYVRKAAWVLTENLDKTLYESIRAFSGRDLPFFATREEALEYLVRAD